MTRLYQTGLTALAAVLIAGCGSTPVRLSEARRPAGLMVGAGSGSWDAVLPGPLVTAAGGNTRGSEYDRRDRALGYRPRTALTALDSWPTRSQPDISRYRRVYLPRDAQSFIYFEQGQRRRGGSSRAPRYDRYERGGQY